MPDRIKIYTVRVCFGGIKCAFVRFMVMEAEEQSEVPKLFDKSLFPRMVYLALGTGGDCSLERGYCVIIVGNRLRGLDSGDSPKLRVAQFVTGSRGPQKPRWPGWRARRKIDAVGEGFCSLNAWAQEN